LSVGLYIGPRTEREEEQLFCLAFRPICRAYSMATYREEMPVGLYVFRGFSFATFSLDNNVLVKLSFAYVHMYIVAISLERSYLAMMEAIQGH
jgi:hypothetical protein